MFKPRWTVFVFFVACLLMSSSAWGRCQWSVSGRLIDAEGVPATKGTVIKVEARWSGPHPWNDLNWPDPVVGANGTFRLRSKNLLGCKKRRDFRFKAQRGRSNAWKVMKVVERRKGRSVRLRTLKAGFAPVGLPHKAPRLGMADGVNWESVPERLCGANLEKCKGALKLFEGGSVPYYRTHALGKGSRSVERAVIMIHGHGRTADSYFSTSVKAVSRARADRKTAVFAPHFLAVYDPVEKQPEPDSPTSKQLYWDGMSAWKRGDKSTRSKSVRKSSFDVVDRIVNGLAKKNRWPNLKTIVIAGHSAGGQFVNRYAASNRVDGKAGLRFYYVVSNPSSYLYLNEKRSTNGARSWRGPSRECSKENKKHYGLGGTLNSYMSRKSKSAIRSDYVRRNVVYFAGTLDTEGEHLDTSCAAMAQGAHRHERARTYFRHLDRFFPAHKHHYYEVAVGHTSRGMFTSRTGAAILTRL